MGLPTEQRQGLGPGETTCSCWLPPRGWGAGGVSLIPEESGAHDLPDARPALPLFLGRGLVAVADLHGGARSPTQSCLAREPMSGGFSGAAYLKVPAPGLPCPPAVYAGADRALGSPRLNNAFLRLNVAVFSISERARPTRSLCLLCRMVPLGWPLGDSARRLPAPSSEAWCWAGGEEPLPRGGEMGTLGVTGSI